MVRSLALALGTAFVATFSTDVAAQAPLQMTEICVTPSAGEFVEIFNPTSSTVDLTDYYLTDATFAGGPTYYWQLTTGGGGGGSFSDFYARFPAGATIAPGAYQTVAIAGGATGFNSSYGFDPTYELFDTDITVPDMLEATSGSISGQGTLTNGGEFCVLLYWDGASELVQDCDYAVWGDKNEAVDKTGVTVGSSTYLADTAIASQETIAGTTSSSHASGNSWQRQTNSEGLETLAGGNGTDGSDETSENAASTWVDAAATPGAAAAGAVTMIIQPATAGPMTLDITGGGAGDLVGLIGSTSGANFSVAFLCPGEGLRTNLLGSTIIGLVLDANGERSLAATIPAGLGTIHFQTFDLTACRVTNVVVNTY